VIIGVLGGGQLGRFLVYAAREWDVQTFVLDPDPDAPAAIVADRFRAGSLLDFDCVHSFAHDVDLLTVEIENVNADALEEIATRIPVRPSPKILRMVQDKGLQKTFYKEKGIPTADFRLINGPDDLPIDAASYPLIVKMRRGGYDGRGVKKIASAADRALAFDVPLVQEPFVKIDQEISVIVARNPAGQSVVYPATEMVFNEQHVLDYLLSPARVPPEIEKVAESIALELAELLHLEGILAVEMFVSDGNVIVNEIAPRPHNSGHSTIEGNLTSQYEQHLRMILDFPQGATDLVSPEALLNLLGQSDGVPTVHGLADALSIPGVHVHLYGKAICKKGRKMGHVTVLAPDRTILLDRVNRLRSLRVGPA